MSLTPAQIALIPSPSLPIGPQLSHLLQEFTALSLSLFTILALPTPPPGATAPIYASLALLDRKFVSLLALAARHEDLQRRIDSLSTSLSTLETSWQQTTSTLHSSIASLSPILASGKASRASIETTSLSSLTPSTLRSYARLLAPFTSAPPSSLFPSEVRERTMDPSGRALPEGALPPFPTEGAMKRGRLQFGRGEVELGETGEVGGTYSSLASLSLPRLLM